MRSPHTCGSSQTNNVLINLRRHAGRTAECKCITVNPSRPELLAVGASDPYVRIYDRRMIKLTNLQVNNYIYLMNELYCLGGSFLGAVM